jgi:hypothetical protein
LYDYRSVPRTNGSEQSRRALYGFATFVGALLLAFGLFFAFQQYETKNWPIAQGTVTASTVRDVSYRYEVSGKSYTGHNAVTALDTPVVVSVHYNPLNPAQGSINTGVQPIIWMLLLFGGVAFFGGLANYLGAASVTGGTGACTYDGYGDVSGGIGPSR